MDSKRIGTFEDLLAITEKDLCPVAIHLKKIILELDPNAYEVVQLGYKTAAFGIGPKKMSEGYAYIMSHKNWVNLGFYKGAVLPDTGGLLEGTGKNMRHINIHSLEEANCPEIKELLRLAAEERKKALKE